MSGCFKSSKQATPKNANAEEQTNKKKDDGSAIIISVIGLDDSGKSTFVKILAGQKDVEEVSPTVGYEPHDLTVNKTKLKLFDLGGGARVRDIWRHYFAESFGFIYLIDTSNRKRLAESKEVFMKFLENERVFSKPILVIGNKQDRPNSLDESEIVQFFEIEEMVNKFQNPCRIETTSFIRDKEIKIEDSVNKGLTWLIKYILSNQDEIRTKIDYDTKIQRSEESKRRKEKSFRSSYGSDFERNTNEIVKQKEYNEEKSSPSPRPRLSTIDEEKQRLRINKNFNFMKKNKLSPYDDKLEPEPSSKNYSWAVVQKN